MKDPNLPPRPFQVEVNWSTKNSAHISWSKVTDPEGSIVTYSVYLGGVLIEDGYTETIFLFNGLLLETTYTGEVHAADADGKTLSLSEISSI